MKKIIIFSYFVTSAIPSYFFLWLALDLEQRPFLSPYLYNIFVTGDLTTTSLLIPFIQSIFNDLSLIFVIYIGLEAVWKSLKGKLRETFPRS